MRVIVLGGAGDMGSRAVRDLAGQPEVESLVVADYDEARARALVASLNNPRISAARVDANDPGSLVDAMCGCDVAASAVGPFYRYEVKCAAAAIGARCHYVSLCDDYDAAQAVLELDQKAKEQDVTVLTGLGWTPGISNILARKAADAVDTVEEIKVAWGGSASDSEGFAVILHTLHIFSGRVPSFQNGRLVYVPAGSGKERVRFPAPVGEVNVFHLGHPEPVTLPRAFPGVRTVTLKGGLSEGFLNSLAILLNRLRLTNTARQREVIGKLIKPLLPALGKIGRPACPCSAVRVDVKGTRGGKLERLTYGAADHMNHLTGVPLAIGTVMLGRGEITRRGVVAPELCIPPDRFISELARRGITIYQGDRLESALV
ncbi:MAG: saccharopine dehydrogenase NADP-binding domain-containing protein [Armatimonadetes bacterium]|nr:saccharopine dehydrogenase NADP-binding domain-containing protein [Armatimonadota bacterium]